MFCGEPADCAMIADVKIQWPWQEVPGQGRYDRAATWILIAILAVVTVTQFFLVSRFDDSRVEPVRDFGLVVITIAASFAMQKRQARPDLVFVALAVCGVAAYTLDAMVLAPLLWAYGIVALGSFSPSGTRTRILILVAVLVPPLVALIWGWVPELMTLAITTALAAAAVARRDRRRYAQAQKERARLAAERSELLSRTALQAERTRIANDLHDSVAQTLAIIAANAAGAARVVETDPSVGKESLEAISQTAREAAQNLRNTVFELRNEDETQLLSLEQLAERLRDVGQAVDLSITGDPTTIPPLAYAELRLVAREALTNALKYCDRSESVRVGLDIADRRAMLEVRNQIAREPQAAPGGGHGLISMQERMDSVGGRVHTTTVDNEFILTAEAEWETA